MLRIFVLPGDDDSGDRVHDYNDVGNGVGGHRGSRDKGERATPMTVAIDSVAMVMDGEGLEKATPPNEGMFCSLDATIRNNNTQCAE